MVTIDKKVTRLTGGGSAAQSVLREVGNNVIALNMDDINIGATNRTEERVQEEG